MDDVEFSDKYQPLFDLVGARENMIKDPENEYLLKLLQVDTVLMSGGRDSGKTFGLGCFVGTAASDYNHRILYTRQTMARTSNSIVKGWLHFGHLAFVPTLSSRTVNLDLQ